jgi:hypothetical protein
MDKNSNESKSEENRKGNVNTPYPSPAQNNAWPIHARHQRGNGGLTRANSQKTKNETLTGPFISPVNNKAKKPKRIRDNVQRRQSLSKRLARWPTFDATGGKGTAKVAWLTLILHSTSLAPVEERLSWPRSGVGL